jgi:hypothetical protein
MLENDSRLPNAFILGAAKAGTTTLYNQLKSHPAVFLSFDKEPRFFSHDRYYSRGFEWYLKTHFEGSSVYPIRGEATPHYLYWAEKVSPRLKAIEAGKRLKLIVILRNPIDRAYSWYWNMVMEDKEDLPFWDALQNESSRLNDHRQELEFAGSMQYGYLRGSCYASQIQHFLANFKKDQFHFILFEDLVKDQERVIEDLLSFLDIEYCLPVEPRKSNPSRAPRSRLIQSAVRKQFPLKELIKPILPYRFRYRIKEWLLRINLASYEYPPMEERARSYLRERLAEEITALSAITGNDLEDWA